MKHKRTKRVLLLAAGPALLLVAGCDRAESPAADGTGPQAPTDTIPSEPAPRVTEGGPELTFVTLEHDFGEIWDVASDAHTCVFEFTNTGDRLLEITEIKPSCGCTTAELTKREYGPGEGAAVEITFDPENRQGRQTKTIDIVTNAERQGPVQLRITAELKPFVALEPRSVRFDDARLGEARTAIVEVRSADPGLVLESIENTGNHVGARLLPGGLEAGPRRPGEAAGALYSIEITLEADAPWGETNRTIIIKFRGRLEGDSEEITHSTQLGVRATVFGELRTDPPSFRLISVPPGESVERRIRLTSASGAPFTIHDVRLERGNMPELQVRAEPIEDEGVSGYELVLSGSTGSEAPKSIYGAVIVETDVPGEERIEVPCYGTVRALAP